MSKFDDIVRSKMGVLAEDANPTGTAPAAGTTPTAPAANTPTANTATQTPPATQSAPDQQLAQVFKSLKFSDANTAAQTLQKAYQTAGNVPGMKEFFSNLAFDPQKGFSVAAPASTPKTNPPAAAVTPGTTSTVP